MTLKGDDGAQEVDGLKGVSLHVARGEVVALVGENGAGKSTLLALAAGVARASSGEVWVAGREVTRTKGPWDRALRAQVGIAFQYPERGFFAATVLEEVGFTLTMLGHSPGAVEDAARWALSQVGLDAGFLSRSPFGLSGGEKRRVALASAIAHRPGLLLLDEPEAGMDLEGRRRIATLIVAARSQGAAVIVATHDVGWALEWADRVALLEEGRLRSELDVRRGAGDEAVEALGPFLWDGGLLRRLWREARARGVDAPDPYKDPAGFREALRRALVNGAAHGAGRVRAARCSERT